MHTFLQITQVVFNSINANSVPVKHLDGSNQMAMVFCKEQIQLDSPLSPEKKRGIEFVFFLTYIINNSVTTKTKFSFFKRVLENTYINTKTRNDFLFYFTKIQKTYYALSKFAAIYKHKKARSLIETDIYLNQLNEAQPRVFALVQDGKKYLFTITDLINILNTSLSNTFMFIAEPHSCKNPYTNMPFNKSTLYNIYFFIKRTSFNMPPMFHQYFMSNFNLAIYAHQNDEMIREYAIKDYIFSTETDELYYEIKIMLSIDKIGRKIKIDEEFPKDVLVSVFRPYLELYYKANYTLNESKREKYMDEYYSKLTRFYNYNKKFGRRFFVNLPEKDSCIFSPKHKLVVKFDDNHIPFSNKEKKSDFATSHIFLSNPNDDYDENDNDEYTDY